ncbi:hypothetical protein GF351_05005 [Candidatus Woesearchaeota archaeon]|nr:hypothetical protein [Candidatus Woesearchaeota archaeon]
MIFKQRKLAERMGESIGFLFSYLTFTAVLFLILHYLQRIPETWSVLPVAGITLAIVLLGTMITRLLR